jgi:hypothetical protein
VFSVVKRAVKLSGSTPGYCVFVDAVWLVVGGGVAAEWAGAAGPHAPTIIEIAVRPIIR